MFQLRIMGEVHFEMLYYNEKLAVWEPLLEPVMDTEDNYRPWEVLIKVSGAISLLNLRKWTNWIVFHLKTNRF